MARRRKKKKGGKGPARVKVPAFTIESDFEPVTPNTEAARKAELTKMYPDEVKKVVGKTAEEAAAEQARDLLTTLNTTTMEASRMPRAPPRNIMAPPTLNAAAEVRQRQSSGSSGTSGVRVYSDSAGMAALRDEMRTRQLEARIYAASDVMIDDTYMRTSVFVSSLSSVTRPKTFELAGVLHGHSDTVKCLSYDGVWLISGSFDRSARAWRADTGLCQRVYEGHDRYVMSTAFEGKWVLTGSADCRIGVWDHPGSSDHRIAWLTGHEDTVTTIRLLGDTKAVSGDQSGGLLVWSDPAGDGTFANCTRFEGHDGAIMAIDFTTDMIVSASRLSGDIKLWNEENGDCYRTISMEAPVSALSMLGDTIFVGTRRGTLVAYMPLEDEPLFDVVLDGGKHVVGVGAEGSRVHAVTGIDSYTPHAVESATGELIESSEAQTYRPIDVRNVGGVVVSVSMLQYSSGIAYREFAIEESAHLFVTLSAVSDYSMETKYVPQPGYGDDGAIVENGPISEKAMTGLSVLRDIPPELLLVITNFACECPQQVSPSDDVISSFQLRIEWAMGAEHLADHRAGMARLIAVRTVEQAIDYLWRLDRETDGDLVAMALRAMRSVVERAIDQGDLALPVDRRTIAEVANAVSRRHALVAGALDPAEFWTVSNLVHILEEGLLPSQHRHAARLMSRGGDSVITIWRVKPAGDDTAAASAEDYLPATTSTA